MVTYRWVSPSTPLSVNGADGVVIEGRGCLGFLHEPLLRIVVSGQLRREEFERNRAFELGVQGRIHDTRSAATKLLRHPLVGNCLAFHRGPSESSWTGFT